MKKFFLLLLLCPLLSFGQNKKADSLQKVFDKAKTDTARVRILNQMADALLSSDPVASLKCTQRVISMYDSLQDLPEKPLGDAYLSRANGFSVLGDYSRSLESALMALRIAEQLKNTQLTIRSINM